MERLLCYSKASSMTTGWLFMHIRLDTAKQQATSHQKLNQATQATSGFTGHILEL